MKIIIDIPKEEYLKLIETDENDENGEKEIPLGLLMSLLDSVKYNCTPLPKGHGRLIDADNLMEYCQNDKSKTIDCNDIARFPTIIEANKESEEEE